MQLNDAPNADVVMSCRVRLARNLASFPFVNRANEAQQKEIVNFARQIILSCNLAPDMYWVDLNRSTTQDRQILVERHLISRNHAESESARGVAISGDESLAIMVNEEDHLRMQVLAPGLQLDEVNQRINAVDDTIEQNLDYAFSSRWGYLTACPTNVGTGIRFSVMMHLPALRITNEIERVRRAAKDLNLAVRGYYGEGSESAGDFYQVSNQITLGKNEFELLASFRDGILPRIIDYEHQARNTLLTKNCTVLDDRTHRALGLLRTARLLGTEEAMKLLSRVRLGIHLKRLTDVDLDVVNRLFLQIQPAHLKLKVGDNAAEGDSLRAARAELVRDALAK
jgi:protein arginine kinase